MATPVQYKVYKSDTDKAKLYNRRLAQSDSEFDKWSGQAKDWWDRYENVPKASQSTPKGHIVNVPTGVATIDALFSGLTAVDVEFVLEPMGKSTPDQALLAETALNQEWAIADLDVERNAAIKDALILGIGFVKVGYDFYATSGTKPRDPEDIRNDVRQLIAEARAAGELAPEPEVIGRLVPTEEDYKDIVRDRIVTDYVPWENIRWDPTAKRWEDVKWVCQYTKLSLAEVQANPLWREYVKRNRKDGGLRQLDRLTPDSSIDRELLITGRPQEDDGRVTVCEYWDLETGTVCTFARGQNFILFEGVNPNALALDYPDRSPFVPLVLRSTNRRVRGIGDMEVMVRSLNEKNLYRSKTANYIDRIVPKLKGPEDALTDEGKAALANSEIGAYVSVAREHDPKSIDPLDPPQLPVEAFNMNDRIDDEIREATGVNELMRGLFPDRKRTATETTEVVSASAARQSEKRNTLERFHVEIAKRILTLMQKFFDGERMARYSDPSMGNVEWNYTGADIVGTYDINVHLSPREAMTRDSLKQEATVALNLLQPFTVAGEPGNPPVIDKQTLVGWFMRKYGFSRLDINELMKSPEEQQVAQAGAAQEQAGGPPAGPLGPNELLAATNAPKAIGAALGAGLPEDVTAGAAGGTGPGSVDAATQVSESYGGRAP